MLRPRVIPCLLLKGNGLVKTVQFAQPKYVGDPLNAVRIFNEKEVDELVVLDIDATVQNREPNFKLIGNLASECRMPLCYGGGVTAVAQAERIIGLGVEKVAVSSAALGHPKLVEDAARVVGSQSVVAVLDVKLSKQRYEVWTHNGTRPTGKTAAAAAAEMERAGAGEIVVNNIDRDGTMRGYDADLIGDVRRATTLPITALGGASSLEDIRQLVTRFGLIGAAAGSLFVFKGVYRAVLINYPSRSEKDSLLSPAETVPGPAQ